MESYGIAQNLVVEDSTSAFRCSAENVIDNDDEADDASEAMEEHLRMLINRPLINDFDNVNDDDDDNIAMSLDMSNIDTNDGADKTSQLEWNEISLIIFQDESIESIDVSHVVTDNTSSLLKPTKIAHESSSVHKFHHKNNKKKCNTTNDYSSSSEGTADEHQNSDQTCPETPPTPLSFESVDHLSTSSLLSVHEILQQQQHHDYSDLNNNTPPKNSFSNPSFVLPTPPHSESCSQSLRSSLAYNPITSHSPRRKSRSRRQRASIGMSLFSCLDGGSDDVLSDSDQLQSRSVFRQRNFTVGEDDDDDGIAMSTCDSEEALEHAAQVIRSQLLQNEMLDLAAEAEKAADSGIDRFTRHPVAGVIQYDRTRTTATTTATNTRSSKGKLSIQAMRRSLSEGSYVPQQPTRISERNKSTANFVSNIIPLSSNYINPTSTISSSKYPIALRDVNEVFPTFQSFHAHLRTHFIRGDVSPSQLTFQEEPTFDENRNTAVAIGEIDGSMYNAQKSPSRQIDPFCKSDDSPLGSVFSLPLCSNETTSTPLTTNRKLVGDHSQPQFPFPIGSTVPANNFLQNFRFVDQWSHAITTQCRSNANHLPIEAPPMMHNRDDQPNDDSYVVNLLSVQVIATDSGPHYPRKIDILPDLEYDYLAHVLRKSMASSTIRLQPKIGHRNIYQETINDAVSFTESSSSLNNLLTNSINDPKALFDETEYDSDEDCGNSIVGLHRQVLRINSAPEPNSSLNSLLDDAALIWTPTIGNTNYYRSHMVEAATESGINGTIPPPPSIPDFVTPARLRKIRGSVRRAVSHDTADTVVDAIAAHLPLPIPATSISQEKTRVVDKIEKISSNHNENEESVEIEEVDPKTFDMYAIEAIPENDLSSIQNESRHSSNGTEDEILNTSLTVLDLSHDFHKENVAKPETCLINTQSSEETQSESKSDPVMIAWLKDVPSLPSLKTPKSCKSLDGFISKVPSHHDCGCLSLSPASSTCSDDDIRRSDMTADGNDIFTTGTASLRKVLSSGAINDYQSWDAFLERFHAVSPLNAMENSVSSTPKRRNSIRDAMSILSSKLSPNRKNSIAQEEALKEQRLQALRDQIKDNDEFMNNFLYCSKPLNDLSDSITTTNVDADAAAVSQKADRTTSLFMCMDDNMMSCGETDNGYCCNYFLDGALTMGNIILPTSFSTRHRPPNHPNGTTPTHQRVRSFINLGGGAPVSRRESYHSESTNHHNSSSWLDLANELDGAFDTWVLGAPSQTHISNVDVSETCLSHVSFQPPSLKKLRNILEDFSNDESEEIDRDDGEHKYDDEIWMVRSPLNDTRGETEMNDESIDFPEEQKM